MQLISKYNKIICFLLCVIVIYSKYVWVVSLKIQKIITISKVSQNFLDESVRKPNKLWVDNGRKFCNRSTKS